MAPAPTTCWSARSSRRYRKLHPGLLAVSSNVTSASGVVSIPTIDVLVGRGSTTVHFTDRIDEVATTWAVAGGHAERLRGQFVETKRKGGADERG